MCYFFGFAVDGERTDLAISNPMPERIKISPPPKLKKKRNIPKKIRMNPKMRNPIFFSLRFISINPLSFFVCALKFIRKLRPADD